MQENFNFFFKNLHFFVFLSSFKLTLRVFSTQIRFNDVRLTGLEPARRETPDPKSDASTNSATGANRLQRYEEFFIPPKELVQILSTNPYL